MSEEIVLGEGEPVVVVDTAVDPLKERDEKIAKLTEEKDNYKHVALKRLGKLPGDSEFVAGADANTGLTVEETVRKALLDQEIAKVIADKEEIARKAIKENGELRLALKNRPQSSIGGEGGTIVEVKDTVFTAEQLDTLTKKAIALKADPVKFIEKAKQNFLNHR